MMMSHFISHPIARKLRRYVLALSNNTQTLAIYLLILLLAYMHTRSGIDTGIRKHKTPHSEPLIDNT